MDSSSIPTLKRDSKLLVSDSEKTAALADHFNSVFTIERDDCIPFMPSGYPAMDDITITEEGVFKLLKNLDTSKAVGPDEITARMLKESAKEIAPVLTSLFQQSLDTGDLPDDWLLANVTALFKKGSRENPENYRPVSLTAIMCKLLEHILHSQISKHLDKHKILTSLQHGFRKGHSCVTQLIQVVSDWMEGIDNSQQIDAAILDFTKAFDCVPHERLKSKLHHYGVRNKVLKWISMFLTQRQQRVIINGETSKWHPVISGVPQGTVLGPLLFLIYINDIVEELQCSIRLFADDCILYTTVSSIHDCNKLQKDLDTVCQWASKWQMTFNPSKCNFMSVGLKRSKLLHKYTMLGETLAQVHEHTYLGVTISDDLTWKSHYRRIVNKANKVLGILQRNVYQCSSDTKGKAYKALVQPHLEYASAVTDPYQAKYIQMLDKVQRRAARFVVNDFRRKSSVTGMLRQLEWESLADRRLYARLSQFYLIHKGRSPVTLTKLQPRNSNRSSRRFTPDAYNIIESRTDRHLYSFLPRTIRDWNDLPLATTSMPSLDKFKAAIKKINNQ